VERINPYAVMRNTATLEAYRARQRALMLSGQPFTSLAVFCLFLGCFLLPRFEDIPRVFGLSPFASVLVLDGLLANTLAGGVFAVIAVLRIRRYGREHPIPDEWRQVPRASWPTRPRQRPPA
jgi:hypothetical protein